MDEKELTQHYNLGYLRKFAQAGIDPDKLEMLVGLMKHAGLLRDTTDAVSGSAHLALLTLPAAMGVLTGALHHKLTSPGKQDVDDLKARIILDEYDRETDNVRRRTAQRQQLAARAAGGEQNGFGG